MSSRWTNEHKDFCVKHKFPASTIFLFQYILTQQTGENPEIEFNLKSFNTWIEKERGKPLDTKTVKSACERLLNSGAFKDLSCVGFKWYWKRWIIMPLTPPEKPVLKRRKSSETSGKIDDLAASNAQNAVNGVYTTTTIYQETQEPDLQEKLEACQNAGVNYQRNDGNFLRYFSWEQIKKAIAYFLFKRSEVDYPEGWFRRSLEGNYADKYLESQQINQQFSTSGAFG